MSEAMQLVVGMSIAYVASGFGLGVAWWAWRRKQREKEDRP